MATFGERLKQLRTDRKLTQREVAEFLQISVSAYQNYEYDRRDMSITSLTTIADYFEVSLDYLIGRSDDPDRH